ncbi:MAG: isoleucine--tRNA ligase [Candidatus Omnitrophica bacterium]|nr:isoleucine--tRNA ligase [Candidatus Omnitrophota bacterium]
MDYKSTLNLPKTSFPMKGDLPQAEPQMLARWESEGLYAQIQQDRKEAPPFILHDGPPYANGDIHIGHALNKILKDVIVRCQTMKGRRSPYVPGWDCHGLPIEYALMRELKVTKHQVDVVEFRKKARAYAHKYVGVQREQFKRLGVMGDWANPYLTLEPGYVAAALRALAELTRKGFIYRARKPVNWCWSCETALAEAEVEYDSHTSPAIFVKFDLTPESVKKLNLPSTREISRVCLIIWTTTPWTLMGNVAVAVHPGFDYALRKTPEGEIWVMLADLPEKSRKEMGAGTEAAPLKKLRGSALEGLRYRHPFGIREGKVVLADYVSAEDGTGLVHTAPGFGAEDYATGRKYELEVLAPVDAQGKFTGLPKEVARFNGKQVQESNPAVIELLTQKGALVKAAKLEHTYPHCWRCRNPIIFRATDQWFLAIEHQDLRAKLLQAVAQEVDWFPPVGRERMAGMVKTRPDWCLSRQRLWGIPIPAVVCASCGEAELKPEVIEAFAAAAEKETEGSDRWFSEPVSRWLPEHFTCKCGSNRFDRGTDILDVWFDSGVSHRGVLDRRKELMRPADLYLEGSDQHRGWFQVSLITGVALEGKPPYRGVLTHGFVVDGDGRKMSKSLGNVVAPQEVISSMGAEVLRLWVASSDYAEDVRISPVILGQVSEAYRKVRNTVRFLLSNLSDFKPEGTPVSAVQGLDRWILCELRDLVRDVTLAYDAYAFHRVVKRVHEFCTVRLSNFYLDVVKDRLYTAHPRDPRRLAIQRALWEIARALIRVLAPILPVTAEEAWGALTENPNSVPGTVYPVQGKGSVHRELLPRAEDLPQDAALQEEWRELLSLRDQAMKALEEARAEGKIGDALEADLEVVVRDEGLWKFLGPRQKDFEAACIVSGLVIERGEGKTPAVEMRVKKAAGAKCQRCWMRLSTVGNTPEHPGLCRRCVAVLQKLEVGDKL